MKNLSILLLGLLLAGCSIKDVEKSPQSYRLENLNQVGQELKTNPNVLLVQKIEGDSVALTKTIFYKKEGALKPYKYSRWSEIPAIALQQLIVEDFEKRALFKATVPSLSLASSDLILESDLRSFEQVFDKEKSFVHVKMRFRLIQRDGTKVVATKFLEKRVAVNGSETYDVIKAFNEASSTLINDLGTWIKGLL